MNQWNLRPREPRKCHYCGKIGHIKDNCWALHGGPNTRRPEQPYGNRGQDIGAPRHQEGGRDAHQEEEVANVCHETEQVDYEIVLHAEELRLPITGGVMGVEGYFADEIVPEMSEFKVEDYSEVVEEVCVEGGDYLLPRNEEKMEPTGCDEELGLVARDVTSKRDEDDWWNAYIATAEATICPVSETEGANFVGSTDVKVRKDEVNEEIDSNDGWQVVKRKQSKTKKGTKVSTKFLLWYGSIPNPSGENA